MATVRRDKISIKQFTIMVIFLFTVSTALADQNMPIGKVVALRGEIVAENTDSIQRVLSINAPVFLNDTIKTRQGRIQLIFNDNTLMTLGSSTEIKLTKYSWKTEDKNSAMETRIEEGSFRIMGGAITRIAPDNFKTHTPSGTIGIRGSMYAGVVKGTSLSVVFQGGRGIYIKNDMGFVSISAPGFGTQVKSPDQAPEPPRKMTQEELRVFETVLAANPENTPSDPASDTTASGTPESSSESSGTQPADGPAETVGLLSEPAPDSAPLGLFSTNEISDITETTLASAQATLNTTLAPTGVEQEILSILLDLGYTGSLTQSSFVPSTGIWVYSGKMKNLITSEPLQNMKFIVNWDNGRIIGLEEISAGMGKIDTGFGFGTISASGTISGLRILGSDGADGSGIIRAMTGNETFGHFYGLDQSGLGLAMEGYDINLQNQADQLFWKDLSAAIVSSKTANTNSGTESWKGFFTGVAEDMASPNTNRRIFTNNSSGDFALTINKDAGTLTGSLSGEDFLNAANQITGLTIGGGGSDSVYITDKIMGASLSGTSVIDINGNTGNLKSHGNFMIASDTPPLSTYTTWGYWEAAYSEPVTGKNYHIHVPGSLWIAGNPTPSTTITSLIGTSFTGTYTGKAEGVMFDNTSQMTRMTNGTTNLAIDFSSTAPTPVSGSISFTEVNLPVTSSSPAYVGTSGFSATIPSAVSSAVNGTFYGPGAEAAAGNFSATMADGKQYHGIFAGNR